MIVLGLQRGHDAGVCIAEHGIIRCMVEAERVHRIKHVDGPGAIPEAFRLALSDTGIYAGAIDRIVIADNYRDSIEKNLPHIAEHMHSPELISPLGTVGNMPQLGGDLGLLGVRADVEVFGTCHHAAHAAAAIYMSGYDRALTYVYDGYGTCCGSIGYTYKDGCLERIEESRDRILVGWRYQLLGNFIHEIDKVKTKIYDLAGKIMGLNAFGTPDRRAIDELKDWLRKDYRDYARSWDATTWYWFPGLVNEIGFGRNHSSAEDPDLLALLASLQVAIDEVVGEEIKSLIEHSGIDRVVVAGGCAYNILTNDAIGRIPAVSELFVPPNAGDSGLAMGAALIGSMTPSTGLHFPAVPISTKRSPYKGPYLIGSSRPDANPTLPVAVLDEIVERLSSGGIVGFVTGRLEIGPRALGHRSLLADATHPQMREIINQRVKKREWWRPFAPVARSLDAREYFQFDAEDPYMLRSAIVREEWRSRLIPIVHRDMSARLQVLADQEVHPELWYILTSLKQRIGIGVCLNTSLNLGGAPILNSIDEIAELLETQDIDFMYVDGSIVRRGG